jgi:hypothetical protein
MNADEIPQSILKKYPELTQILEAIKNYHAGQPITTRCKTCNRLLEVTEVPAANSLWVTCGNGCTNYREQYKP